MLRTAIAACLLAVLLFLGARGAGSVPPMGTLLEPAHGAWALARTGELPRSSTAIIPGLSASVDVRYDTRGVPHIFATTEDDAYRALGYVVARDRLFQLWIQTLAASGRLTEIAGARALPLDREMRRLGLGRAAERRLALVDSSPETARLVDAYAEGVNAYIDRLSRDELPLEFRLLRISQVPRWQTINSMELLERMGWTLAYFTPELERARAAARVGAAAAASLFPDNSPIQEPVQPNGRSTPRFDFTRLAPPGAPDTSRAPVIAAAIASFFPATAHTAGRAVEGARGFASNNWAVAGARSASGTPLLAGDPHLELTLPSIWYEAHLVVPGVLDVYGVTIPGAPGIVIGFNRDVAWTFSNTGADVLDFYAERVNDAEHPTMYMLDGVWHPLERRIETYRGPHEETVAVDTVYYTHRGPMRREAGDGGTRWLSMRWTVLEPSNEPAAFLAAAHARDVTEFQTAMGRFYKAPAQNMLVADRRGSIAIRSTGRFPIRPGGGSGFEIRDGSTSASDWRGSLPVEFAPQALNPPQGYLASANQQPIDPKAAPYWLGGLYEPWRAMRINQLLRADSQVTLDDMRRFQTDPGSARADFFVPYFLAAARNVQARPGASPDPVLRSAMGLSKLGQAAELLKDWDRRYTADDRCAAFFEAAYREMVDRTWDELDVGGGGSRAGGGGPMRVATPSSAVLASLLSDPGSEWWDNRSTSGVESRDDVLAASLVAALDAMRARYGDPMGKKWAWGRIQHANIWHPLHLKSLSALNLPVQGGPATLSPSSGSGGFGASWRMVVETAPDGMRAWGTYPGGQSGNPASSRYRDHLPDWLRGQLEPLLFPRWVPELDAAHTASRLTLRPKE